MNTEELQNKVARDLSTSQRMALPERQLMIQRMDAKTRQGIGDSDDEQKARQKMIDRLSDRGRRK